MFRANTGDFSAETRKKFNWCPVAPIDDNLMLDQRFARCYPPMRRCG